MLSFFFGLPVFIVATDTMVDRRISAKNRHELCPSGELQKLFYASFVQFVQSHLNITLTFFSFNASKQHKLD